MKKDLESEAVLEKLIAGQRLAVLATTGPAGPYLSLVAIAPSADRKHFYFGTPRATRKFANLEGENRVALLLDDRPGGTADFSRSAAATITGTARELSGQEHKAALALYLARHPALSNFASSDQSALFEVSVSAIHLADGFK